MMWRKHRDYLLQVYAVPDDDQTVESCCYHVVTIGVDPEVAELMTGGQSLDETNLFEVVLLTVEDE